jgi:hypothetical protein
MVRQQYLLLTKRWHPDRHATDATNQNDAADRMREINQAYQLIVELATSPATAAPSASPDRDFHGPPVGGWDSSRNKEVIQSILKDREGSFDSTLSAGRKISLIVSALYLAGALLARDVGVFAQTLAFLVLPMACIWYGDAVGSYVGGRITHASPGIVVTIGGWFLLALPIILALVSAISG